MPKQARFGDMVSMNCPHGGTGMIVSGSGKSSDGGQPVGRVGDTVVCMKCGKSGRIIMGSPNVQVDGLPVARIGDLESGTCSPGKKCCPHGRTGTIITGSPTTNVNG